MKHNWHLSDSSKTMVLPRCFGKTDDVPWATPAATCMSRLSVWWITLGIVPDWIQPGKPKQNDRHERMHRTLKQAATKPPGACFRKQQALFDQFCNKYNMCHIYLKAILLASVRQLKGFGISTSAPSVWGFSMTSALPSSKFEHSSVSGHRR